MQLFAYRLYIPWLLLLQHVPQLLQMHMLFIYPGNCLQTYGIPTSLVCVLKSTLFQSNNDQDPYLFHFSLWFPLPFQWQVLAACFHKTPTDNLTVCYCQKWEVAVSNPLPSQQSMLLIILLLTLCCFWHALATLTYQPGRKVAERRITFSVTVR